MTGKMWAPSESDHPHKLIWSDETCLQWELGKLLGKELGAPDADAVDSGIGNAEEVMGKEVTKHKGPLELPW